LPRCGDRELSGSAVHVAEGALVMRQR
jgi:hypothetical protein